MVDSIITAAALRKEYYEVVAVDDIDLAIPAGEIFGFIGPNGAGKTSTLRMFATTLEPTAGKIYFQGVELWKKPRRVRNQIGFMPDFFQLYGRLKVVELLNYFGMAHGMSTRLCRTRVPDVLKLVDLEEKQNSLVKGLSRGMMQRLCLARAILHRPKLLLLDEPASGLDPVARKSLFDLLARVRAEGATIVISSHILAELSDVCTSIGIMHHGRFLETGRTDEIIKKVMPKRQIAIQLVTPAQAAVNLIAAHPGVSQVNAAGSTVRFMFEGPDTDLAKLNASLVAAGVGVALLTEGKTTLHELYFAITERNPVAPPS